MKMTKKDAIQLWFDIIEFAKISYELGGDSGFFYTEEEEKKLMKEFKRKEKLLTKTFSEATGFLPVKHLDTESRIELKLTTYPIMPCKDGFWELQPIERKG